MNPTSKQALGQTVVAPEKKSFSIIELQSIAVRPFQKRVSLPLTNCNRIVTTTGKQRGIVSIQNSFAIGLSRGKVINKNQEKKRTQNGSLWNYVPQPRDVRGSTLILIVPYSTTELSKQNIMRHAVKCPTKIDKSGSEIVTALKPLNKVRDSMASRPT